jgi:signal transduction histidine kinase
MRRRLVLLVVATSSLVLVAFLLPLAVLVRTVAEDRAVNTAVIEAQSLTPLVATLSRPSLALAVDELNTSAARHPVTVFLPDGTSVGEAAQRSAADRLASSGRSITAQAPGGLEVLVAVQGVPGGTAVIRIFVTEAELRQGVVRAWLLLGAVGVGLLLLSVAVADRLARSLVRPLTELARASDRLGEGDLAARAVAGGPPEVRQVGTALNGLAERIVELLARERESAADLSHRLRTPLTALRIDAETITDPVDRQQIGEGVDAIERTVSEIIREMRRPAREGLWATCDAVAVVHERAEFWSVLAEEQQRLMVIRAQPGPLPVRASSQDLAACLDVLLENVFAHTPEGVAFTVELEARADGGALLSVADAGPGFAGTGPPARGSSGHDSTGLGLDIARHTSESSGGALLLTNAPTGGARVTLQLGAPLEPVPRRPRPRRHRAQRRTRE